MERVMNILKPKPEPQQLLRDWQHRIRKECLNIDRQIRDIHREEKNVQKAIKEAAKRNDMGSAKALAKEVVRSSKTVNRLSENRAQLNSISMRLGESVAFGRTVGHLSKSAEVMKLVNNLMKAPQVAVQEFSKEMIRAREVAEIFFFFFAEVKKWIRFCQFVIHSQIYRVILTTLLKVYVKCGLFDKSRKLLDELQFLGYADDEMPYCVLMDGLAKTGKLWEAKSVFDEMRQKEVKNFDARNCYSSIRDFCLWPPAKVYSKLCMSYGYSYSIMISTLCHSGHIEEAKQLACEFETKYGKYDVVILNSMLSAYCRSREMENVMKIMRKMDESAISPDWNTFHCLIKYFCKEKLYLLAYRTMEDMHKKGHQPDEDLSSSLINHLGKTGAHSEAFSVYNMLRYSKRIINKTLHEKILHILLAGGLLKDAYVVVKDNTKLISQPAIKKFATSFMRRGNLNLINDVIKTLHNSGNKIDQDIFHMAISRYIEQPEKKELYFHLLQWMPGQGFPVDSSTRDLILENAHLFGRHSIAELLSKHYTVLKKNKSHLGSTK
ncbi:hypothetical protein OROGR_031316 [Orobanche gracilis]